MNCKYCGKELKKGQKKYCSNKCQHDYQHYEWVEKWKSGDVDGMIGQYQASKHIKRYLLEKYGCKCQRCGWGKVNKHTGNIPLEIDHIDGDYKNNRESNLTLLCPNCHSLTDTYKGANKGKGREPRGKYYKKRNSTA